MMNYKNKSHNRSHNDAKSMQKVQISTYDLKYVEPPFFVYFSISETPLPNNPKAYTAGFGYECTVWEDFYKITQRFSYSNAIFKDGYRKVSNITGFGNLLIFDVDANYDINEVRENLKGVKSFIATTRSHTPEHHKFRIVIPVDRCMSADVSKELYNELMRVTAKQICDLDPDKLDKACFGLDRQYAPNANQQYRYIKGDITPLDDVLEIAKANLLNARIKRVVPIQMTPSSTTATSSYKAKREYIKNNFSVDYMKDLLYKKGLIVKSNGNIIINGNKTKAVSLDLKSGYVRDFAKNVSYDPVSLLFDVYQDGTLTEITDTIYQQLKEAV